MPSEGKIKSNEDKGELSLYSKWLEQLDLIEEKNRNTWEICNRWTFSCYIICHGRVFGTD